MPPAGTATGPDPAASAAVARHRIPAQRGGSGDRRNPGLCHSHRDVRGPARGQRYLDRGGGFAARADRSGSSRRRGQSRRFPRFIRGEFRFSAFAFYWPALRRRLSTYDVVNLHGPVPTISEVFLLLTRTLRRHQRPAIVYTHHSDLSITSLQRACSVYNGIAGRVAAIGRCHRRQLHRLPREARSAQRKTGVDHPVGHRFRGPAIGRADGCRAQRTTRPAAGAVRRTVAWLQGFACAARCRRPGCATSA